MEKIALATILIPFIGAFITACSPYRVAKQLSIVFALLATLGTVILGWEFLAAGKEAVHIPIVNYAFTLGGHVY